MRHSRRKMLQVLVPAAVLVSLPAAAEGREGEEATPIAVVSGVHEPRQGFALSTSVPSDRMCVELAQNLASELGIVVHLVCTDPAGGSPTIVAECGYGETRNARKVERYRHWGRGDPFLICVPPDRDRFRAQRIVPDLDALRPRPLPTN